MAELKLSWISGYLDQVVANKAGQRKLLAIFVLAIHHYVQRHSAIRTDGEDCQRSKLFILIHLLSDAVVVDEEKILRGGTRRDPRPATA